MVKDNNLTKVSIVSFLGLLILISSMFWLKGYKFHSQKKIKVYFSDVSGLEEGSIVRWSGLRVGVVEKIVPLLVLKPLDEKELTDRIKNNRFFDAANKDLKNISSTEKSLRSEKDEKKKTELKKQLLEARESLEIHTKQGDAFRQQKGKALDSHAEVTIVITKRGIPFGPLSRISIVPSGLIGDHFVEITPVVNKNKMKGNYETVFITSEPLRFERFLKANIESSEAFRDAITKINRLLKDEDIGLLRATVDDARLVIKDVNKLVNNATTLLATTSEKLEQLANSSNSLSASVVKVGENINQIIGDDDIRKDLKNTTASINVITTEIAKLLDEEGLSSDILEISENTKLTSAEISEFISDIKKTHEDINLPQTLSNINSLAEKLDHLSGELSDLAGDEEVRKDIKVTIHKARQTSENLEKVSKRLNKRFLLFRLLF